MLRTGRCWRFAHSNWFGITWDLFPSTSDLLTHYSFSEPQLHTKGLDPWSQTLPDFWSMCIHGSYTGNYKRRYKLKRWGRLIKVVLFSSHGSVVHVVSSPPPGIYASHFGDPGTHKAEILFYSTWRTQSLVHRRHLKMLQRRENKLRPHRRQTRGLEFRHHSHTGLPNSAFSAFSLLSRFEKAPERGYCCFFRLV